MLVIYSYIPCYIFKNHQYRKNENRFYNVTDAPTADRLQTTLIIFGCNVPYTLRIRSILFFFFFNNIIYTMLGLILFNSPTCRRQAAVWFPIHNRCGSMTTQKRNMYICSRRGGWVYIIICIHYTDRSGLCTTATDAAATTAF